MIYDIFMTRWDEPDFNKNHAHASEMLDSHINSMSNVSGIHDAHLACARAASTEFFWCIDGDNWLLHTSMDDLAEVEKNVQPSSVYVMRALNPFNGLIYGHGAIKLFHAPAFIDQLNRSSVDMTSGARLDYRIVHRLASEHRYHASAFHAWRTAFRECVKLASSIIPNTKQDETSHRLSVWCDKDRVAKLDFWQDHIQGALHGREYGIKHKNDKQSLAMINNFDWLRQEFLRNG